jgi:hypothetical protein
VDDMNAKDLISRLALSALFLTAVGCDDDSPDSPDAGGTEDAGAPDAGDGVDDAGAPDAGDTMDGGLDAGVDAGEPDAGEPDGGGPDGGEPDGGQPLVCNGAAELCDRAFNAVAFPATHNAMSAEDEGFANSDQQYGLAKQLEDGIRAMELDVWSFDPKDGDRELYLCHGGGCSPGRRKLTEGLADISAFLAANPNDVLTLLFEDHVPGADILAALETAGLRAQTYDHPLGTEWPTLRELIEAGTRLITLYENQGGTTEPYPAGYQVTWDYGWDTDWAFTMPSDFDDPEGGDCAALPRGSDPPNSLFILNHMLDTGAQAEEFAQTVNLEASLLARAEKCQEKAGQIPNFIKVDYYHIGDVFSSIRKLNGLE